MGDVDQFNSDDPFAESSGGSEGGDPFDFGAAPSPPPSPSAKTPPPSSPAPPLKKKAPATSAAASSGRPMANLTADVPVQVVAVLGKKPTTIKEVVSLKKGQVIELNRFPNEAIDLVVNGRLMAKGELVEIDGKLGVRIIKIFE